MPKVHGANNTKHRDLSTPAPSGTPRSPFRGDSARAAIRIIERDVYMNRMSAISGPRSDCPVSVPPPRTIHATGVTYHRSEGTHDVR